MKRNKRAVFLLTCFLAISIEAEYELRDLFMYLYVRAYIHVRISMCVCVEISVGWYNEENLKLNANASFFPSICVCFIRAK